MHYSQQQKRIRLFLFRALTIVFIAINLTLVSRHTSEATNSSHSAQSGTISPDCPADLRYDAATRNDTQFNATFHHAFAEVKGVRMHYVIGGHGPVIVLQHGWPETWYAWHRVMPELARTHTVVAAETPGQGDSVGPVTSFSKRILAQYLHELVSNTLGYKHIDLVGHDFGAAIGYQYAAQYPHEVQHLVILDYPLPGPSTPKAGPFSLYWHFGFNSAQGNLAENLVHDRERTYYDYFWNTLSVTPGGLPKESRTEYMRTYCQHQQLVNGFQLDRTLMQDEKDDDATAKTPLQMPVLVLAPSAFPGDFDLVLNSVQPLARNVHGVPVPNAGHYIAEENPQFLLAQLRDFLAHP